MKGGDEKQIPEPDDPGNLRAEEIDTNERAKAVTWFCGETKVAVVWLSEAFNQFTKIAKTKAGKK
jgi:hypothetical protein